jgi:hypothetical protein
MKKLIILLISFLFISCDSFPSILGIETYNLCGDVNAMNYDGDDGGNDFCEYCADNYSTEEERFDNCCLVYGAVNFNLDLFMILEGGYIPQDPTYCIFNE